MSPLPEPCTKTLLDMLHGGTRLGKLQRSAAKLNASSVTLRGLWAYEVSLWISDASSAPRSQGRHPQGMNIGNKGDVLKHSGRYGLNGHVSLSRANKWQD